MKDATDYSSSSIQVYSKSSNGHSKIGNFIDSFKRADQTETTSDLENGKEQINSPLEQNLKDRHIQMIAIAGCVGLGLFISQGSALATSGPGGLVISYSIIGLLLYFIVQSLGQLTSAFPVQGNFLVYNVRFIDESWGFAMNWNYCFQWLVTLPLSLVSASLTIQFWGSSINSVVWVAVFYVIIVAINIFGVKGYGEAEFIFSLIKVVAIVGFCILAIIVVAGGGQQGYIGGKFWHNPGTFSHGFKRVCSVFVNAAFSFAGTELCALAAAESKNPRRALTKAIKQVFWRIIIFYMLSTIMICFLVPYNDPKLLSNSSSSASPFVVAIQNSGIKVLPSIFNVVILIAVLSVANASVYASYRPLVSLAHAGHGPKILAYVDRNGRPLVALLVTLAVGLLGFVSASPKQETVFNWLLALSGLSTIFTWFSISLSHIRVTYAFKVQGVSLDQFPFRAAGNTLGAYFSLIINVLVLIAQFYVGLYPVNGKEKDIATFLQVYLAAPVVLVFYLGHKIWSRNWKLYVRAKDMDITTDRQLVDIEMYNQLIAEEKLLWVSRPWYYRLFHTWC